MPGNSRPDPAATGSRLYTQPMTNPAPTDQPAVNEHTWRRRLLHLTASIIIAGLVLGLEYRTAVYIIGSVTAAMAVTEAIRLAAPAVNERYIHWLGPFMKPRERRAPTAATYHALGSLTVLLVFGSPIAALAVLFMGIGDPAAGVVGTRYGRLRVRVPGRRTGAKSVEGTLAFLASSSAVVAVLWAAGVYGTLWPALAGAAVAALVEFLPIPVEDNVTVPLASAAVMWALWPV
ncbi:MAG: SEC59/DGK1/VTE5 family protein [Chloroflexota bacterium]|nr:SEC59/DGK1/VTE5 family protein [Chloroflexota bacterium]